MSVLITGLNRSQRKICRIVGGLLFAPMAMIFFSGCSLSSNNGSSASNSNEIGVPLVPDFLGSQVISASNASADGQSAAVVVLKITNGNGSAVVGYFPTYTVSPTSGVTTQRCSATDSSGMSSCSITSIVPGNVVFSLTNAKKGLSANLNFTIPQGRQMLFAVAGQVTNASTAEGHKVTFQFGSGVQGFQTTATGGYHLTFMSKAK
jgi:hypothetical protein